MKLAVIPQDQPVSAIPWYDVNMYDELGTTKPRSWMSSCARRSMGHRARDVTVYLDLVHRPWESALTGDGARALLARLTKGLT